MENNSGTAAEPLLNLIDGEQPYENAIGGSEGVGSLGQQTVERTAEIVEVTRAISENYIMQSRDVQSSILTASDKSDDSDRCGDESDGFGIKDVDLEEPMEQVSYYVQNYFLWWFLAPFRVASRTQKVLHRIIESHTYNISVVLLVLLDMMCVIFELLIDMRVFTLHKEEQCLCEECPAVNCSAIVEVRSHVWKSLLEGSGSTEGSELEEAIRPSCELVEAPEWIEDMSVFFWLTSCTILTLFVLEIPVKFFALKWRFFYPSHIFDGIVVGVSWVFDVFFRDFAGTIVPLLIVLRLWRLLRVAHGIIHFFEVKMERKMEKKIHAVEKHLLHVESEKMDAEKRYMELLEEYDSFRSAEANPFPGPK